MKKLVFQRFVFLLLSSLLVLLLAAMDRSTPSGSMVFPADAGQAYASLADALIANNFCADHLPTWIPEDFTITAVSDKSNSKMLRIAAEYESTRGVLQIRALITSNNVISIAEKDSGGYKLVHNGIDVYVYTNQGDHRATWFADDILFTVSAWPSTSGTITERELLTIIRSIPK